MQPTESLDVTFGSPEFGCGVYAAYSSQLDAIRNLEPLMNDMFRMADENAIEPVQKVVYIIVRVAAETLNDVLILAGNGSGVGAMKMTRGMFESAVMAEYLRRNPAEADDFREHSYIRNWNRYQMLLETAPEKAKEVTPDTVKQLEANYNRVVSRFKNNKGRVRNEWHKKPISLMAREVERAEQYETPYSLAASLHHGNFEGIAAHLHVHGDVVSLRAHPSLDWIPQALVSAHVYMLQALESLNNSLSGGFDERIRVAVEELENVWKKNPMGQAPETNGLNSL